MLHVHKGLNNVLYFIPVNPLVKPRPPSATSIPAILKALQDEWVRRKSIGLVLFNSFHAGFVLLLEVLEKPWKLISDFKGA